MEPGAAAARPRPRPSGGRPPSPARGGAPAVGRAGRSRWPWAPPPAHAQPPGMAVAMAPRVLPLPRQQSFSPPIVLNPFVHSGSLGIGDKLRVRLGAGGRGRRGRAALPGLGCARQRGGHGTPGHGSAGAAPNQRSVPRRGLRRAVSAAGWGHRPLSSPLARAERGVSDRGLKVPPAAGAAGPGLPSTARAQRRPCPAPRPQRSGVEQPRLWAHPQLPAVPGTGC